VSEPGTTSQPEPVIWSPGPGDWLRGAGICLAAGIFMAVSGAFGSNDVSLTRRLIYWIGLMFAGSLIGNVIARPIFGSRYFAARPWLGCILVTFLLTPPLAVVVWAASNLTYDLDWNPFRIVTSSPPVAMISFAMTIITYLADRRPVETHVGPAGSPPPRFLDRLPMKLKGAELYAVEAEDHYLRLHTDRGSDLILMRLSDAVGELDGIEGAQTHRSWWVAKHAVVEVSRGDGRATFVLRNGARAPVSRSYARALRAEGWY
jgi:hypothetical protein